MARRLLWVKVWVIRRLVVYILINYFFEIFRSLSNNIQFIIFRSQVVVFIVLLIFETVFTIVRIVEGQWNVGATSTLLQLWNRRMNMCKFCEKENNLGSCFSKKIVHSDRAQRLCAKSKYQFDIKNKKFNCLHTTILFQNSARL